MAKQLRVHILAKELGVESKDIIAKCQAEGVENIKTHMSVISLGLAESIREWFTKEADVTSVEVAQRVDQEKIRKPRKQKTETADHEAGHDEHGVQVLEEVPAPVTTEHLAAEAETAPPHAETAPVPVPETLETVPPLQIPEARPEPVVVEPISTLPEAPPVEEMPPVETRIAATTTVEGPPVEVEPAPIAAAAPPPSAPIKPVFPAGPQVVPKPAELRGPRLVRMEAPEPVRTPRPRSTVMEAAGPAGATPGTAARRGLRDRGGRTAEEESEAIKSRARSPRRRDSSVVESVERMREYREQDVLERKERLASATGHGLRDRRIAEQRRRSPGGAASPPVGRKAEIEIVAPLPIKDFCAAVGVPFMTMLPKLMEHTGAQFTINQSIDAETIELLAVDLGLSLSVAKAKTALEKLQDEFANRERPNLKPRPPVVAMLGHVDHGKTSLLDAIRRTDVAAGEAGGITQHIGAYRIDRGDWHVTFLDTPGHEAFTSMRARGANLTDVVVLVVAADDGVMPQTVEAINHAKAAGVAIVIALNKIDLPGVDLNRIYSQLSEQELVPTEWGGHTDVIKTSAVKNIGIDELIAHLSTLSELLDLKADATVPAQAVVIEARMQEGQGVVAQVLVREGTLKVGQFVVCGPGAGRIRTLIDEHGRRIKEAGPGTPVGVVGLEELPEAGDPLYQVSDLARAKDTAAEVKQQRREATLQAVRKPLTLEDLLRGGDDDQIPELNVIVKSDVQGSADVLRKKLSEFPADKARLKILHAAVGAITEADVRLAQASEAIVIGFHVVAEDRAKQLAEQVGVEIRLYRIIYEVIDDLHKALEGLLEPIKKEEYRAKLEVRQAFNVSRFGTIAGCYVTDGTIARNNKVRLIRNGRIVLEGSGLASLKRFKDDVREVSAGFECGVKIQNFDDVKPGDIIEAYEVVEVAQRL